MIDCSAGALDISTGATRVVKTQMTGEGIFKKSVETFTPVTLPAASGKVSWGSLGATPTELTAGVL